MKTAQIGLNWGERLEGGFDRFVDPAVPVEWYKSLLSLHIAALADPRYDPILDLGAGTGNLTYQLLKNGKTVYAHDGDENALRLLEKKCEPVRGDRLHVRCADALLLPYDNDFFGGVSHTLTINFLDRERTDEHFRELYRVLRTRGRLAISGPRQNWNAGKMLAGLQEELERADYFDTQDGRRMYEHFGKHLVECRSRHSINNMDPKTAEEKLERAGFSVRETRRAGYEQDWFIVADKSQKRRKTFYLFI